MGQTKLKLHTIISQYTFNNNNAKLKLSISWFRYSKLNAKLLNIDKTEKEDTFLILAGFSEARNTCDRDAVLLEDTHTTTRHRKSLVFFVISYRGKVWSQPP